MTLRVMLAIGSMGGGGSERQVLGILKYLDRSRFTPLLYLIYRRGELLSEIPADVTTFAFSDRHRGPRLNWPGRIHRMQVNDLEHVLQEQLIDVLYDRTFNMTLVTAAACRRARVPRISVAVSDPAEDLRTAGERYTRIKRRLLRKAYLEADLAGGVSHGVTAGMARYYRLPPERLRTIENFLDLPRIRDLAGQPGADWDPERFHIIAVGRLHQLKGYSYLLQAVDELVHRRGHTRLCLHLVGSGPMEAELKACVCRLGLTDHVRFEGYQANPYPFFARADLCCLSSIVEGSPNVLMEAMLIGTPVLATDCPSGPREIVADGRYGDLVPPSDPSALADGIAEAILHPERWRVRAAEARAFAESRWSPQAGIAKLEQILSSVCVSGENRHE